jgi:hypothetical protein
LGGGPVAGADGKKDGIIGFEIADSPIFNPYSAVYNPYSPGPFKKNAPVFISRLY